jgi:NarL family two-component system response regulator LiaR
VIRILVADDHTLVRRGIRSVLEQHGDLEVVAEAADGRTAARLAEELRPDVVLLDLVMPGGDGTESLHAIRSRAPHTQVVVLTTYHRDDLIVQAIRAGAVSYLLKDVGPGELVAAVRAAAMGQTVLQPAIGSRLLGQLRGDAGSDALTRREREVLAHIARGRSNQEIALGLHVSVETVKSHVSHILTKLGLEDRTQAAIYALERGLVPPSDTQPPA